MQYPQTVHIDVLFMKANKVSLVKDRQSHTRYIMRLPGLALPDGVTPLKRHSISVTHVFEILETAFTYCVWQDDLD